MKDNISIWTFLADRKILFFPKSFVCVSRVGKHLTRLFLVYWSGRLVEFSLFLNSGKVHLLHNASKKCEWLTEISWSWLTFLFESIARVAASFSSDVKKRKFQHVNSNAIWQVLWKSGLRNGIMESNVRAKRRLMKNGRGISFELLSILFLKIKKFMNPGQSRW